MSTRERWIVYSLLFMTLGIALRDKVMPPTHLGNLGMRIEAGMVTAQRIRCSELAVTGPKGQPVVVAGTDAEGRAGLIETFTTGGKPQVRLFSNEAGGALTAIERAGKLALVLGDTGQNFGLFAEFPELGQLVSLASFPLRFESKPTRPQPPKGVAVPEKIPGKQPTQKPQGSEKKDQK
jgi:hypothetical protein